MPTHHFAQCSTLLLEGRVFSEMLTRFPSANLQSVHSLTQRLLSFSAQGHGGDASTSLTSTTVDGMARLPDCNLGPLSNIFQDYSNRIIISEVLLSLEFDIFPECRP